MGSTPEGAALVLVLTAAAAHGAKLAFQFFLTAWVRIGLGR